MMQETVLVAKKMPGFVRPGTLFVQGLADARDAAAHRGSIAPRPFPPVARRQR